MCVSVEASVHGTSVHCSDKTIEAAEALLRMDSPSSLREDRSPGTRHTQTIGKKNTHTYMHNYTIITLCFPLAPSEAFIPPHVVTPDFLHAAMRPDMITETEVEISTEDCCEEEDEEMVTLLEEPEPEPEPDHEPIRKRRGRQKEFVLSVCTSMEFIYIVNYQ